MNSLLRSLLFLPENASTVADRVDQLHAFVISVTMLSSAAVALVALGFFVRYRRRTNNDYTPHVAPSLVVETLFVVVPLAIFLLWFAIGFRDYVYMTTSPANAMDVYVMGKQWMWKFSYPDGPNSVSVLRVPAHRPMRLLLTSRDVIHSFYVPEFRLKKDALPGRYTELWFEATKPGRYQVLCAEYCGLNHSTMWGEVVVMEPGEFDAWFQDQKRGIEGKQDGSPVASEDILPGSSMAKQGEHVASVQGCFKCHTTNGEEHIGPSWLDLYRREETLASGQKIVADEAYLTKSMMDPRADMVAGYKPVMPSYQGQLSAPESAALVEYIKSLSASRINTVTSKGPLYEPSNSR